MIFLTFWNDVEILNQVKTIKISTDGKNGEFLHGVEMK